jgi:drug/metabolite transporter (DMT)-like permease
MHHGLVTRRGIILFALLGVAWGIPYLLIKIAVGQLDPAMLVFARTALAAVLLLPVAAVRGEIMTVLRRWKPLVAYALAEIIVPQFFLSSAEERLPSSTSGLLIAAVPLAGVGVAFLLGRRERLAARGWLGIGLGMAGVAALVGFDVAGSDLGAVGEVLIVVVGYALGPAIIAKWLSGLPGAGVNALALGLTALVYAPVVAATHAWPARVPSPSVLTSVILLGVVCSAAAFTIMTALVAEIGPVRATTVTYVNPAVALVAGALVLGEPVTGWSVAGFALILTGCGFVSFRGRSGGRSRGRSEESENLVSASEQDPLPVRGGQVAPDAAT